MRGETAANQSDAVVRRETNSSTHSLIFGSTKELAMRTAAICALWAVFMIPTLAFAQNTGGAAAGAGVGGAAGAVVGGPVGAAVGAGVGAAAGGSASQQPEQKNVVIEQQSTTCSTTTTQTTTPTNTTTTQQKQC